MLYKNPLITINTDWEKALSSTIRYLKKHGFRVVCSFNMQIDFPVDSFCSCPLHDTEGCNCSMAVLLLYAPQSPPVSILVHGHEQHVSFILNVSHQQYTDQEVAESVKALMTSQEFSKNTSEAV